MYPNVGAAGCGLVGAGGVLGLRPCGSGFALAARCMNSYYTICIKKCMNWYKKDTVYKFVLYNFVQKLVKKRFASGLGFQPGTKMACNRRSVTPSTTPSPPLVPFIYIPYNKNTIRKSGLYGFIRVAYSQSHLIVKSIVFYDVSLPTIYFNIYKKGHRMS